MDGTRKLDQSLPLCGVIATSRGRLGPQRSQSRVDPSPKRAGDPLTAPLLAADAGSRRKVLRYHGIYCSPLGHEHRLDRCPDGSGSGGVVLAEHHDLGDVAGAEVLGERGD